MKKNQAEKILSDEIDGNGALYSIGRYIAWERKDEKACLDGNFSADELEAIAWWMKNNKQ